MSASMITAHSGCEDTEIDSLESVEKALEYGADAIEVDVRVDPSGTLRISHNVVPAEEYARKLTLRAVLERVRDTSLAVNFDLKEQAALYKTIGEARSLGFSRERLIFSGCTSPEQMVRDEHLAECGQFFMNVEEVLKYVYYFRDPGNNLDRFGKLMSDPWSVIDEDNINLTDETTDGALRLFRQMDIAAVNLPKTMLGTRLFRDLKARGIPISVWTVNDPAQARVFLEEGVFNITTRKVKMVLDARAESLRQGLKQPPIDVCSF